MGEIGSYVGAMLCSILVAGSIITFIYFVFCKITKRQLSKKVVYKIYMCNLVFWGCSIAFAISSKFLNGIAVVFASMLMLAGMVFGILTVISKKTGMGAPIGNGSNPTETKKVVKRITETKCTCQACCEVWYYGMGEYWQNKGQRQINAANQLDSAANSLFCASGCVPAAFIPTAPQVPVKDLNKCPKCNSSAIKREKVIHEIP